MNSRLKKRVIAVSGIVIIALILVLAIVGGGTAAKTVSVSQAVNEFSYDQKIQVSGNVVPNSFSTSGNVLTFKIYDPEGSASEQLTVEYKGSASSTFGNDVTAICTGRIGENGVLDCSELVTKCPSKYEDAEGALTLTQLFDYGNDVVNKMVKVSGVVEAGTLVAAGSGDRFVLVNPDDPAVHMPVLYEGALSDEVSDGSALVLTGTLDSNGKFNATDVALEG